MRIVCRRFSCNIISYFFSKIRKDVAKFVICCSRDWCFKGFDFLIAISTYLIFSDIKKKGRNFFFFLFKFLMAVLAEKGNFIDQTTKLKKTIKLETVWSAPS